MTYRDPYGSAAERSWHAVDPGADGDDSVIIRIPLLT